MSHLDEGVLRRMQDEPGATSAADNVPIRGVGWSGRLRESRAFRPLAAGALTLGLMATLVVSGVAEKAVQVFEPRDFAVVNVDPATLGSLPDLSRFGTYTVAQQPRFRSAQDLAAALTASGLKSILSARGPLPAAVKGQPVYETFTQAQASFTFKSETARAYA
ncbi:MAG: hypothetical protein ABR573_05760, partial [Candidatus Dormibacteria bacterium]